MQTLLKSFVSSVFTLIITLALMAPYESANAAFVVEIDDPDTSGTEFRCVDGDGCDLAGGAGVIQFSFNDANTTVTGSATSKPAAGNATNPIFILDVDGVATTEDSIEIRITDTDFISLDSSTGLTTSSNATFETAGLFQTQCYADTNNEEFGTSGSQICQVDVLLPAVNGGNTSLAVFPEFGSLTLVTIITDVGGVPPIDGTYTVQLDFAQVPDVVGLTEANATIALEDAGYNVISIDFESCEIDPGIVAQQDPIAGDNGNVGSDVTIAVAVLCPPVPNVVGLSDAEATTVLEDAGYGVSRNFVPDCSVTPGIVLDQIPEGGEGLPTRESVRIFPAVPGEECIVGPTTPKQVPTLSEWAMILLMGLLALIGLRQMRRS